MTRRMQWGKFHWDAWENDPALSMCSMAAQGFWMRLLCLCAKADGHLLVGGRKPTVEVLSHITRQPVADINQWLSELGENGVFSRTRGGVIYSRRMRVDLEKQQRSREFGKLGGNPSLVSKGKKGKGVNPPDKVETETEAETEPPGPQRGKARASDQVSSSEVDAIWALANSASRQRSSKEDLRRALDAAAKRGGDCARIATALRGYFVSDDATRDGGAHAKGIHRLVQNDRWKSFEDTARPEMGSDWSDGRWQIAVEIWRDSARWEPDLGPEPGQPGCRVPAHLLIATAEGAAA